MTALAREIERATSNLLALDEADLAPACRTRLALATLERRASRRDKRLVLWSASRELRRVAHAAGWAAEPPPRSAAVESRAQPPARPSAPRVLRGAGDAVTPRPQGASAALLQAATSLLTPAPAPAAAVVPAAVSPALAASSAVAVPAVAPGTLSPALPDAALPRRGARRRAVHSPAIRLPLRSVPAAVTAAVLLFGAVAVLPSATVRVTPVSEPWSFEAPVVVDPSLKSPDVARGRLPGRTITREIAETATAPATGRKTVPDAKATGEVIFLNRSDKPVGVPKGTVVMAGQVRFATQSDVTVAPSRSAGGAQSFGMSSVKVTALTGGTAGNVDRNQINSVDGALAGALVVQNTAPTRGGSERAITYVTDDDLRRLHDTLYRTLSERLTQQLKGHLPSPEKETTIPWGGQNPAVVESSFSKNADDEAQSVTLSLKLRYAATAFSNDAYNAFVRQLAAAGVGQSKAGFEVSPDAVEPHAPVPLGVDNGSVRLTARASATASARVDEAALRAQLAHRPLHQVDGYLGALPGVAAYEVQPSLTWLGRMPWLGWRIAVATHAPAGGTAG